MIILYISTPYTRFFKSEHQHGSLFFLFYIDGLQTIESIMYQYTEVRLCEVLKCTHNFSELVHRVITW